MVWKSGGIYETILRMKMCRLYIFQQNNSMQWNRKVLVHIDSGEALEMYGKLRNIETDLPRNFIRIHQSYIVNSLKIQCWKAKETHLVNAKVLPISQSYRKQVAGFLLNMEE